MRNKKVTKIMSYLLTTAMIVGGLSLSPLATVEVMAAPDVKNINLNVGNSIAGIANPTSTTGAPDYWTGSKVYMGNKLWRVLDPTKASTGASGYAFLLSEEILWERKPYHSRREIITWADCQLRKDLNGTLYTTIFSTASERNAVAALEIENLDRKTPGSPERTVDGGADTVDKLFLLSLDEAKNENYGFANDRTRASANGDPYSGKIGWLRSPGTNGLQAAGVFPDGSIMDAGYTVEGGEFDYGPDHYTMYSRPAFNLNLSAVLFSSADGETKSDSLVATTGGSGPWKLTLKDESGTFLYTITDNESLSKDSEIKINVTEISSQYDHITAMVLDDTNTVLAYGAASGPAEKGEKTFIIPVDGGTKIKFFAETWNTGNETDYARGYGRPPAPALQEDERTDNNVETKKSEDTFVNPLSWYYEANPYGSLCLMSKQGPVCTTLFQWATPKGFKEAFSFNLLLLNSGVFKPGYDKKAGKFVLNIPKEWQKAGRTFMLIGIDKGGNTKVFYDSDFSDETFTTMLDMDGYAFSLIYKDEPVTKK